MRAATGTRPAERLSRRVRGIALGVAVAVALAAAASPARADEYDSDRAAHPLRILAYVVHPVGVLADRLIVRPLHWVVHHEPLKTLFGHEDR